jgi:hypothetical protein
MSVSNYLSHSEYSDPKEYMTLFSDFPCDIAYICRCIHYLFLHYADLDLFSISVDAKKYSEMNQRYLSTILKNMVHYDDRPLIMPRAPHHRVMGICRDSSLLLCSILRFLNIPARLRSGYVNYFIPNVFLDGLVVEFYDDHKKRWQRVDTRTSQTQIDHYRLNISFDLTDLPESAFISAARAWQLCRDGKADPQRFGSRQYRGWPIMRNRLIQDLALLNKQELLVWDLWGLMFEPVESQLGFMDALSDLLMKENDAQSFYDFYQSHPALQVPHTILEDNPFSEERWFSLQERQYVVA